MSGLPFLNIVIISDRHCSILLVSSVNPFESCSNRRPTDKESLSSHCGHTHAQLIKSRATLKKLHRNGMVKWMDGWMDGVTFAHSGPDRAVVVVQSFYRE